MGILGHGLPGGTRTTLNHSAGEQRRCGRHLGRDARYGAIAVAVGYRIICRRNEHAVDVDNGTVGLSR